MAGEWWSCAVHAERGGVCSLNNNVKTYILRWCLWIVLLMWWYSCNLMWAVISSGPWVWCAVLWKCLLLLWQWFGIWLAGSSCVAFVGWSWNSPRHDWCECHKPSSSQGMPPDDSFYIWNVLKLFYFLVKFLQLNLVLANKTWSDLAMGTSSKLCSKV